MPWTKIFCFWNSLKVIAQLLLGDSIFDKLWGNTKESSLWLKCFILSWAEVHKLQQGWTLLINIDQLRSNYISPSLSRRDFCQANSFGNPFIFFYVTGSQQLLTVFGMDNVTVIAGAWTCMDGQNFFFLSFYNFIRLFYLLKKTLLEIINKYNWVYLKCKLWWSDIHVYCRIITKIKITNNSSYHSYFLCMWWECLITQQLSSIQYHLIN